MPTMTEGERTAATVPELQTERPRLAAKAGGQNAIDPAWHAAPASGSATVRRELQVRDPAASMWTTVRNDLPSTRASVKHSSLTEDTRYVCRIRAVNRAADNGGLGNWSTILFAATVE